MLWIRYKLNVPINVGTVDKPNMVDNLIDKALSHSDGNLQIAEREAYNGKYTIEDDGQPEPEQPDPVPDGDSVWEELDAAYQAGYNEGYTEGVNSAYDQ